MVVTGGWIVIGLHGLGNIESALVPILYIEGKLVYDIFQLFLSLKLYLQVAFLVYGKLGILMRQVEVLMTTCSVVGLCW